MSKDFKNFAGDLKKAATILRNTANGKLQRIIGVEGLRHFDKSWDNEGFTDKSLDKWKKRQWNRATHKKTGGLRKDYKRWKKKDNRRLLITHRTDTKGGHLRHSLKYRISGHRVIFYTHKIYAQVHNEGGRAGRGSGFIMPKRQYMGHSAQLDRKIKSKIDRTFDNIFK